MTVDTSGIDMLWSSGKGNVEQAKLIAQLIAVIKICRGIMRVLPIPVGGDKSLRYPIQYHDRILFRSSVILWFNLSNTYAHSSAVISACRCQHETV